MATFSCKTKGNADPKGKPRVYFCCHPEDFDRYFDKVREDIFKTHDCAIYYTADMTEAFDEHDMDTDLGQMNLFVVPVTFRLLSQPNRAMDVDLAYAKRQNIAILPFMMESGIDAFYSAPEKFGQRQYINPYSTDTTEISYEDKLKKYLEAVLISDETAQRVRDAFDAYIFLSYRKKDRRYANQLMRLIHKNPEYRDIAIWYDEFLTPGESFKQNIDKAMQNSKLFTLLVTPNLLEYVNGKPNFVMGVEYPAAKAANMGVLPAEMVETDKAALREKYADIPDCVTAQNEVALRERLLEALDKIAKSENNNDPEHNFLIGLAYLDGIDVEVDRDRALALITSAAEADLPEAMEKLKDMYKDGIGVQLNYKKAVYWAEKTLSYSKKTDDILGSWYASVDLANILILSGNYQKAEEIAFELYVDTDRGTWLDYLANYPSNGMGSVIETLALAYGMTGEYHGENILLKIMYQNRCEDLGTDHPHTLSSLSKWASSFEKMGDLEKARELGEQAYQLQRKTLGDTHSDTIATLSLLTSIHRKSENLTKALEMAKQCHTLRCNSLGEQHPLSLISQYNLAKVYRDIGQYEQALIEFQTVHASQCNILGADHPDTLNTWEDIATTYTLLGNLGISAELHEKVYTMRSIILGKKHPDTINSLNTITGIYCELKEIKKLSILEKEILSLRSDTLWLQYKNSLTLSLNHIAKTYFQLGALIKYVKIMIKMRI